MLDKFRDATGEAKLRALFRALIRERDFQALVQESVFAKACGKRVVAEYCLLKNGGIRMERYLRSGFARLARLLELRRGLAFFVRLLPHRAVALNFQLQPIGKGVNNGNANAVQTA